MKILGNSPLSDKIHLCLLLLLLIYSSCVLEAFCCLNFFADVYAKRTIFVNQLGASGCSSVYGRRIGFQLNHRSHISTRKKQHGHYMKAVATVDSKFLVSPSSENTDEHNDNLPCSSISVSKMLQSSTEENTPEIDEREKLRRMRISKANKGNVPWNKGRKHSAGSSFRYYTTCDPICLLVEMHLPL